MPYVSMKDIKKIDRYLTKQLAMNQISNFKTDEEKDMELEEYREIAEIFIKIFRDYKENNKRIREYIAEKRKIDKNYARKKGGI